MRVAWLRQASASLDQHYDYLASKNPRAAKQILMRIVAATRRLGAFPNSGRPGQILGTRELVIPGLPFLVVYRVTNDAVEVLRVFHTATDWPERMT
jgi:toxin ParE1/3/4